MEAKAGEMSIEEYLDDSFVFDDDFIPSLEEYEEEEEYNEYSIPDEGWDEGPDEESAIPVTEEEDKRRSRQIICGFHLNGKIVHRQVYNVFSMERFEENFDNTYPFVEMIEEEEEEGET